MRERVVYTPYIKMNLSKCNRCNKCADVCPKGVLVSKKVLWLKRMTLGDTNACNGCMKCVRICPREVFSKK